MTGHGQTGHGQEASAISRVSRIEVVTLDREGESGLAFWPESALEASTPCRISLRRSLVKRTCCRQHDEELLGATVALDLLKAPLLASFRSDTTPGRRTA